MPWYTLFKAFFSETAQFCVKVDQIFTSIDRKSSDTNEKISLKANYSESADYLHCMGRVS